MTQDSSGILEIRISRLGDRYQVSLTFEQGRKKTAASGVASIPAAELAGLLTQPEKYGQTLGRGLFQAESIRRFFEGARAAGGGNLRITLAIDPSAPELHGVAWELLAGPDQIPIAANERTPFSRFLYGEDWAEAPLLEKRNLRVLIAAASPANLQQDWGLSPIHFQHIETIRASLSRVPGLNVEVLDQAVTLRTLMERIRSGVDILYLVCHGVLLDAENRTRAVDFEAGFGEEMDEAAARGIAVPGLLLEKEGSPGRAGLVSGGEFARRLGNLRRVPQLAVLATCESAGVSRDASGNSAQASLAPRLARAGIPAVIAMQGQVSMETAERFAGTFFQELLAHGSIDRAVAAARGSLWFDRQQDSWMPALFLRIPDGMLWYEPSFLPGSPVDFETIAVEVAQGNCTPIVGWGIGEYLYGTKLDFSRKLARQLESSQGLPFDSHRYGELPLVSQYLRLTNRSRLGTVDAFQNFLKAQVLDRMQFHFERDMSKAQPEAVLREAWKVPLEDLDPYRIVAKFHSKVFVTACSDGLLEAALLAEGKTPVVRTIEWQGTNPRAEAEKLDPDYDHPLLLHVFGRFQDPNSVVLWEDDFLDFLMGTAQHQALIPNVVKDALTDQTLLFLGFNVTDWSFRVLFRMVKRLMRGGRGDELPNVAVQVEPDGLLFSGPEEARDYLSKYYKSSNIEPYWGTTHDFLTGLWPKLEARLGDRDDG